MRVFRQPARVSAWSRTYHREGVRIALVPTMGALHAGHRALIRAARLACDAVVVSLFVNPTQFGPREDWSRYPRPFAADVRVCREEGVDLLFAPSVEHMYPQEFQTEVRVPQLATRWEGAARPGHFSGVATVVLKLLSIVAPDEAYFGQKDFQQCALVRRLVSDLNLSTAIIVRPTVREPDGLALSSRNVFLSEPERASATVLYRALSAGAQRIKQGHRSARAVERAMARICLTVPNITVEYAAVCDPQTLEPCPKLAGFAGRSVVLLAAVRLGTVRLLDNLLVTVPTS